MKVLMRFSFVFARASTAYEITKFLSWEIFLINCHRGKMNSNIERNETFCLKSLLFQLKNFVQTKAFLKIFEKTNFKYFFLF